MITENRHLIIEYLYSNNHNSIQSAVPIQIIHPALNINSTDFNSALDSLLKEDKVNHVNIALFITPIGQIWQEELRAKSLELNRNKKEPILTKTKPKWLSLQFYFDEIAKKLFWFIIAIIAATILYILDKFDFYNHMGQNKKQDEQIILPQKKKQIEPKNKNELMDTVYPINRNKS